MNLSSLPEEDEAIFIKGELHQVNVGSIHGLSRLFPEFVNERIPVFYINDENYLTEGAHFPVMGVAMVNVYKIRLRYDSLVGDSIPKTEMWSDLSVDNFINMTLASEAIHYLLEDKYNFNSSTTNIDWEKYNKKSNEFLVTSSAGANEFMSDAGSFCVEPRTTAVLVVRRFVFRELSKRLKEYQKEQNFVLSQSITYNDANNFCSKQLIDYYSQGKLDEKFDAWAEELKKIPIKAGPIEDFIAKKVASILSKINQNDLLTMQGSHEQEAVEVLSAVRDKDRQM